MTSAKIIAVIATLALTAAACSTSNQPTSNGGPSAAEAAVEFVHVHGLATNKAGTLWVATHRGLIRESSTGWIYASTDRNDYMGFSFDPVTGTMYRSGHPESGGTLGVESSSNGGAWRHLADVLQPPADFHAMALSYADPRVIYGWDSGGRGFFISRDAGLKWSVLAARGLSDPQILALAAPSKAHVVYAGTATGLFRSSDEGVSWTLTTLREPVSAIACDPSDARHLLAFVQSGMKVSRDDGATWTSANQGLEGAQFVGAIAISPTDPKLAYAAAATTLYRTSDGGTTWNVIRSGQ